MVLDPYSLFFGDSDGYVTRAPVVTLSPADQLVQAGEGSCVTDATGTCVFSKAGIRKKVGSITFRISHVDHATLNFDSGASTDPDGDSDGTSITVHKP